MLNPQPFKRPNAENLLNFAFFKYRKTLESKSSNYYKEKLGQCEKELIYNIKKVENLKSQL
jgi:hypothetical protein